MGFFVRVGWGLETTISSNIGPCLLPAGARGALTFSLPRFLAAAGPVLTTTPWPRQRFQATTMGAAIPKLEYVPTTIPTTRAKENAPDPQPAKTVEVKTSARV